MSVQARKLGGKGCTHKTGWNGSYGISASIGRDQGGAGEGGKDGGGETHFVR